jgi:tRNA (uracil-5-)-methyltransferase
MPYEQQLLHKKRTLQLAYERFSRLSADVIPPIQDTIPSPKQWGYRTKITPHFDAMPKWLQRGIEAKDPSFKRGEDGVWRGLVDPDFRQPVRKGRGKVAFGLKAGASSVNEEDAMNEGAEAAEGEGSQKKEKVWSLKIGFEGKGVGMLDIEVGPSSSDDDGADVAGVPNSRARSEPGHGGGAH